MNQEVNILIPMAGLGSRFSREGYEDPKPFIPVNEKCMLHQSLRCLPETDNIVFGSLEKYKSIMPLDNYGE